MSLDIIFIAAAAFHVHVTSPARKKDIGIEESDILLSFSCFFWVEDSRQ
jgi:hypothetical protein